MKINLAPSPYTNEQIVQYLRTIGYYPNPDSLTSKDADSLIEKFDPTLANLEKLVRRHLISFPFENLVLHYSSERKVDVSSQGVFNRAVSTGKGFGSYCFGQNTLFKGILRGLKYRVYGCGARVNSTSSQDIETPSLGGLHHLVLIVRLPSSSDSSRDQLYLTDVGFGGIFGVSGLVRPIPLIDGVTVPGSAAPELHRIIVAGPLSSVISFPEGESPKDWMIQANRNPGKEHWRTLFHFSIACELFEPDVECQSFSVSNLPGSPLLSKLICIKVFEVEGDEGKLGRISLVNDKLVRRIGGSSEEVCSFKTEAERVAALRKYCGVSLEEDEIQYMRDRIPALPFE